jgi:hypothetical protein
MRRQFPFGDVQIGSANRARLDQYQHFAAGRFGRRGIPQRRGLLSIAARFVSIIARIILLAAAYCAVATGLSRYIIRCFCRSGNFGRSALALFSVESGY